MRPLVICGSQRFKQELDRFVEFLEKKRVLIFFPNFAYHRKKFIRKKEVSRLKSRTYKNKVPGMVYAHLDNLDDVKGMNGICLIFNPRPGKEQRKKFGYIGFNTNFEAGYCRGVKLPILLLRPHEEECMMTVVHANDHKRVFTLKYTKADPLDFDFLWDNWLKGWLES